MKIFLVAIIVIVPLATFGQLQFSFRAGYGFYSMSELKTFQEGLKSDFPVVLKTTESYPPYLYYEGSGQYIIRKRLPIGISITYGSSGSRIHYSDYSGEIFADQLANYVAIGLPVGWIFSSKNTWSFQLEMKPTISFNKLALKLQSKVANQQESEKLDFKSIDISIQPGFAITKRFGQVGLLFQTGYNIALSNGNLFLKEDDEYYLVQKNGDTVSTNWAGLRIAAGMSYTFRSRKPS